MPLAHRYALYLAPSGPWQEQGSRWLGRCAETAPPSASPACPPPRRNGRARRATPARHAQASLPPDRRRRAVGCGPGRRRGGSAPRLRHRTGMRAPARSWPDRPRPGGARITRWPTPPCELDPLRARPRPRNWPSACAIRWRRQHALLALGLPYVFDQFTFHITLSEKLADAELRQAQACIARYADPLAGRPMPSTASASTCSPAPARTSWPRAITVSTAAARMRPARPICRERRRHERRAPDLPDGRVRQRQGHLLRLLRAVARRRTRHRRASLHHPRQRRQRGRAAALGR